MTAMPFPRLLLIAAVVPAAAPADGIAPPALGAAAAPPPAISRGFARAYIGGSIGAGRLDADAVFEGLGDAVGEAFGASEVASTKVVGFRVWAEVVIGARG